MIIQKHERMLKRYARKYYYFGGYDNIYNECLIYLHEAYQKNKNPSNYVNYWIRKYCKIEKTNRDDYLHIDFS